VCAEGYGPDETEQCVPEDDELAAAQSAGAGMGVGGAASAAPSAGMGVGGAHAGGAAAARQAQAAAAAPAAAQAGAAKGKNDWFSQMFGGGKAGKGGAPAATDDDTCPGGVCKNPPAKYQGGGGAAGAGGAGGAGKPGPALVKVDTLCKHSLGRGAEFDGVRFFFLISCVL